jgi:hypothetical protein
MERAFSRAARMERRSEAVDEPRLLARDDQDREPALQGGEVAVEREVPGDGEEARRRLDPLEVPAQPEAVVRDAGDHAAPFRIHVSFDPPPCEELTT